MNSGTGQKARGRTPTRQPGSGGGQWENGVFNTEVPGVDNLQDIMAVGTHLFAGYDKKTTGTKHFSQPPKKPVHPQ